MAIRVVIRQDGRVVAEHPHCYGRGETIYAPWHYVPILARKPGALRNGAPFKDWVLPAALEHLPLGLNHPSEKKMLKIKELEHVLIGKVDQLFRNML
jgi:hypothetical protein